MNREVFTSEGTCHAFSFSNSSPSPHKFSTLFEAVKYGMSKLSRTNDQI